MTWAGAATTVDAATAAAAAAAAAAAFFRGPGFGFSCYDCEPSCSTSLLKPVVFSRLNNYYCSTVLSFSCNSAEVCLFFPIAVPCELGPVFLVFHLKPSLHVCIDDVVKKPCPVENDDIAVAIDRNLAQQDQSNCRQVVCVGVRCVPYTVLLLCY